mmetsp:Transcript_2590/g.5915  ORF Transcript_2590/g.5915 Transcript_2590/m.5915 type:complete len:707 (-) Transcript_2590:179-2299(-)|eukprot:CAMPEP_0114513582 /NCGR_PEP_ID=MMETSP0109-20121206/15663_1 /TAXON_ID=29199 /ORGANISM="Chlorarachnion reptans, Strain CCCM449" /LENGTH=706 /DNA_ID=CAMNT_0001693497 /DNA_START=36 /DNA_END=2156 /DNA_ORIENTATION=-
MSAFDHNLTFGTMGLDRRIFKAVAMLGFVHPTHVQAKCIPVALEGRDVMAKAATGSGKTMAFIIPLVQGILNAKCSGDAIAEDDNKDPNRPGVKGLILVPTKELCDQVHKEISKLTRFCRDVVRSVPISSAKSMAVQIPRLQERPDIIVATPSRLVEHLRKGNILLEKDLMSHLVIDEADLVLSYGYEEDVKAIITYLPRGLQTILMSATLSAEVESLRSLVLTKPVVVDVDENALQAPDNKDSALGPSNLTQFYFECDNIDKYLVLYAMIKLKLIQRRSLIFVNSVERCFKLKLFLEQFSIVTAVLNAELPYNSRCNIIEQFHRGAFGYLLATDASVEMDDDQDDEVEEETKDNDPEEGDSEDESEEAEEEDDDEDEDGNVGFEFEVIDDGGEEDQSGEQGAKNEQEGDEDDEFSVFEAKNEAEISKKGKGRSKRMRKSASYSTSYGVVRGVDFKNVAMVVNFDFPQTIKNYTHRVGRTARGGASGTALSLVSKGEEKEMLRSLMEHQIHEAAKVTTNPEPAITSLEIRLKDIEGFRYRVESVLKNVTRSAVKEARLKELRMEFVNSQKLKAHFEDNPRELALLKHAKVLRPNKVQPALRYVPSYLLPANTKASVVNEVESSKRTQAKKRKFSRGTQSGAPRRIRGDPLKTFTFGDAQKNKAALRQKSNSARRRENRDTARTRNKSKKRKPDRNKMAKLGMKKRR